VQYLCTNVGSSRIRHIDCSRFTAGAGSKTIAMQKFLVEELMHPMGFDMVWAEKNVPSLIY